MEVVCIICSSFLVCDDDEIVTTPCRHVFHRQCLSTWLKIAERCPNCTASASLGQVSKTLFLSSSKVTPSGQPQEKLEKQILQLQRELASSKQSLIEAKLANTCLLKRENDTKLEQINAAEKNMKKLKQENAKLKAELKAEVVKRNGINNIKHENARLKGEVINLKMKIQESNKKIDQTMLKYRKYKVKSAKLSQGLDNMRSIEHAMRSRPRRP